MEMNNGHMMHGETCNCMGCKMNRMYYHPVYHIIKKIFILVVIVFAFWLGMRLGEMRTLLRVMHVERGMMMGAANDYDTQAIPPVPTNMPSATPAQ